jgi:5-(carboxyamino)imidazole ribonucleotide mutase
MSNNTVEEAPAPQVAILMGSASDVEVMKESANVLARFGINHEVRVISAHRTPERAHEFGKAAKGRGIKILICGAGKAAHLAGVMASLTTLPVIGVPITTSDLGGLDSLLSTVQMPGGIAVAATAIGKAGAVNAGLLAVQMLALADPCLDAKLVAYRDKMRADVEASDANLAASLP